MYRGGFSLQQYQSEYILNNNERQLRHARLSGVWTVSRPQETQSPHSHIPHLMSKQEQEVLHGARRWNNPIRTSQIYYGSFFLLEKHKTNSVATLGEAIGVRKFRQCAIWNYWYDLMLNFPGVPLKRADASTFSNINISSVHHTRKSQHISLLFLFVAELDSCCSNVSENFFYCILRKATQQAHECQFSVKRMLGFPSIVSCWEHYYQCCCF